MAYPRHMQVSLEATPYYHVVARCVRRAWLCGFDEYAGKDYSHRKSWVLERLARLCGMFAIDSCAYAVLSNHYHLVLRIDAKRAQAWSNREVVRRWTQLFKPSVLIQRWLKGSASDAECDEALKVIAKLRARLHDLSWFMSCLNEYLARRANAEDGCTGRFWEGRFSSQALLDDAGLLTAMAYVDLNPVRAGIAATPEESEFTSIYARIQALSDTETPKEPEPEAPEAMPAVPPEVTVPLLRFRDETPPSELAIPFALADYLELVDWSGRAIRPDKRGAIDAALPGILQRLHIDTDVWQLAMQPGGSRIGLALGRLDQLLQHAKRLGKHWLRGMRRAEHLYGH